MSCCSWRWRHHGPACQRVAVSPWPPRPPRRVKANSASVPSSSLATLAGEVGGLTGYYIGNRWGVQILARPGKRQAGRQKMLDKGERAYAKWGRMAVFFTPAIILGTAKMQRNQFAVGPDRVIGIHDLGNGNRGMASGEWQQATTPGPTFSFLLPDWSSAQCWCTCFSRHRRRKALIPEPPAATRVVTEILMRALGSGARQILAQNQGAPLLKPPVHR